MDAFSCVMLLSRAHDTGKQLLNVSIANADALVLGHINVVTYVGALVIDRINGVAYVDVSERADIVLAEKWAAELGYKDLVTFRCDLTSKEHQ
eukprot:1156583-Pelagomonas_calceolata.AAC.3